MTVVKKAATESPITLTEQLIRDNGIEEIERIILEAEEKGDDPSTLVNQPVAQWNQTPLHVAATEGHFDLVCLFLQYGADINCPDKNNWSALHCAAKHAHLEITTILLQRRADITMLNESSKFLFHNFILFFNLFFFFFSQKQVHFIILYVFKLEWNKGICIKQF